MAMALAWRNKHTRGFGIGAAFLHRTARLRADHTNNAREWRTDQRLLWEDLSYIGTAISLPLSWRHLLRLPHLLGDVNKHRLYPPT